jgi:hypothetical protein
VKRVRPPSAELLEFLAAYDAKIAELALAVRARVIALAPTANETDWDAYNAVAIGFHFTPEWSPGSFCHIAVYAKHVNLGFNRGAELDDPYGVLEGKGSTIRHIALRKRADLEAPYIDEYLLAAIEQVGGPRDQSPETTIRRMQSGRRRPRA